MSDVWFSELFPSPSSSAGSPGKCSLSQLSTDLVCQSVSFLSALLLEDIILLSSKVCSSVPPKSLPWNCFLEASFNICLGLGGKRNRKWKCQNKFLLSEIFSKLSLKSSASTYRNVLYFLTETRIFLWNSFSTRVCSLGTVITHLLISFKLSNCQPTCQRLDIKLSTYFVKGIGVVSNFKPLPYLMVLIIEFKVR